MRSLSLALSLLFTACGPDEVDCSKVGHVIDVRWLADGGVEELDGGWSREGAEQWHDLHPGVCRPLPDAGIAP